jgi:hypothetical protein
LAIVSSFMAAAMNRRSFLKLRGWFIAAILLAAIRSLLSHTPSNRPRHNTPVKGEDHGPSAQQGEDQTDTGHTALQLSIHDGGADAGQPHIHAAL